MPKETLRNIADKIREEADIVDIVGSFLPLKRSGSSYKTHCPFHKEKTPSFNVHPGKQIFHCFGCGVGGDVIKFWMMHERVNFIEAIKQLSQRLGIAMPQLESRPKDEGAEKKRRDLLNVNHLALKFFQNTLRSDAGKKARDYLENRGLNKTIIDDFGIGYAPDQWDAFLKITESKGYSGAVVQEAGLAIPGKKKDNFYDRFRNRIIFPIFDLQGRAVGFGGRIYAKDARKDEPKYINSPETEIYQKGKLLYGLNLARNILRGEEPVLIVEGYMDLIALHKHGFPASSATLGTALTDDQARLLKRFTREVIFLYDGDEAGQNAMQRGCEVLLGRSLSVKIVLLPKGHDPDSFVEKNGADALKKLIDQGQDFIDFFLDIGAVKHKINTPEGKIAVLNLLKPALERVHQPILIDDYTRRISERLKLEPRLVLRHFRSRTTRKRDAAEELIKKNLSEEIPTLEKGFLRMIMDYSSLRDMARKSFNPEWFTSPFIRKSVIRILSDEEGEVDFHGLMDDEENDDGQLLREIAFDEINIPFDEGTYIHVVNRLEINLMARRRHELINKLEETEEDPLPEEQIRRITDDIHKDSSEIWNVRKTLYQDKRLDTE